MATIYELLATVTLVLGLAVFVGDVLLRRRTSWRDYVWRAALVTTAVLPLAFVVRQLPSGIRLELPMLPVVASPAEATPNSIDEAKYADTSSSESLPALSSEEPNTLPVPDVPNRVTLQASRGEQDRNDAELRKPNADAGIVRSPVSDGFTAELSEPAEKENGDRVGSKGKQSLAAVGRLSSQRVSHSLSPILLATWASGVVAYLLWLAAGLVRIQRIIRSAKTISDEGIRHEGIRHEGIRHEVADACRKAGLRRAVPIVQSSRVAMPLVAGFWVPKIAVPLGWWEKTSASSREEILLHEARHIRRADIWMGFLQHLVTALCWPHPLVHWMAWRIGQLREAMCDGHVALNSDPIHYAETLLTSAQLLPSTPTLLTNVGFGSTKTDLERRIGRVLHDCPSTLEPPRRRFRLVVVTCFVLCAATVATVHITAAKADEEATTVRATPKPGTHFVRGTVSNLSQDVDAGTIAVYMVKRPSGGSFTLPLKPQKTTADEQGKFQLDDVPPGDYLVWAEQGPLTSLKHKLGGFRLAVKESGPPELVELSLHEGCRYQVTVRSKATKKPIARAKVRFGWTDLEREFVADEDGVVHVFGLSPDNWFFKISGPDYAVHFKRTEPTSLGSMTEFSVDLDPGGQIVGILRDQDEKPIVGAKINVSNPDYNMSNYAAALTDEKGKFRLPNLPRETKLEISSRIVGFKRISQESTLGPDQRSTSMKIVAERLAYGGDVVVHVVDDDGAPVANAKLINRGNSSADERTGLTDEAGKARLNNLFDSYRGKRVVVRAKGFIAKTTQVAVGSREAPAQVQIKLARGKTIKGRILLPSGEPGQKLTVYYAEGEHGDLEGGRVKTDKDGRFSASGLPEGCTFTIYVPKGCAPFEDRVLQLGEDEEVLVQLEPDAVIRAQAFDAASGKRLENYNVRITFSQSRKRGEPTRNFPTKWIREGFDIDEIDKEFRLGGLPPGMPVQLTVNSAGYEPTVIPRLVAEVRDKSTVELIKLKVIDPSTYKTIQGVVRPQKGGAIAGAYVRLVVGRSVPAEGGASKWASLYNWGMLERGDIERHAECVQFLKTTTDKEGRFTFKNVRPGEWMEVFCTSPGFGPRRKGNVQKLSMEELLDVELTLQPAATIRVLVDRTKYPTAHRVSLLSRSFLKLDGVFGNTSLSFEGDASEVLFKDIPAGSYHIKLQTAYEKSPGGGIRNEELSQIILTVKPGEQGEYAFD